MELTGASRRGGGYIHRGPLNLIYSDWYVGYAETPGSVYAFPRFNSLLREYGMQFSFNPKRQLPSQRLIKLIANSSRNYYFDFILHLPLASRFYKTYLCHRNWKPFCFLTKGKMSHSEMAFNYRIILLHLAFRTMSQWAVQGPTSKPSCGNPPSPLYYILWAYVQLNIMVPLSGDQVLSGIYSQNIISNELAIYI